MKKIYYSIHNLLNIETNYKLTIPNFFITKRKPKKIHLKIIKTKNIKFPKPEFWLGATSFGGRGFLGKDLPFNIKILIKNLEKEYSEIYFSDMTERFYRNKGVPLDIFFRSIILIKLLQKNKTFLHTSSVCDKEGNVISVGGWMETGKTTTIRKLLKQGMDFVSDDRTLIDFKGKVYLFPSPLKMHSKKIPYLLRTLHTGRLFTKSISPKIAPIKNLKLSKIFLLQRASFEEIKKLSKKEALKKLILNYDYEERIDAHNLIKQYTYLSSLDLEKLRKKQKKLTKSAISNADIYLINSQAKRFYPLMNTILNLKEKHRTKYF